MRDQKGLATESKRDYLPVRLSGGLDSAFDQVRETGFTVVEGVENQKDADAVIARFGRVMPQYDGSLAYEVKAEPGFDGRAYSKSRNEIRAHTEAPGWAPPPNHLALWCHVQARGAGGETCLADLRDYAESLDPDLAATLRSRDLRWGGANASGSAGAGTVAPILAADPSGGEILRFSYNLLTSGDYDPLLDGQVPFDDLPWGRFGYDLALQVHEHFARSAWRIRIPENAVLLWDNQRMAHARLPYADGRRHLTRYWITAAAR